MSINFNDGLVGLSLLSGSNLGGLGVSQTPIESRAVRIAKAQYTLPEVTPPWREAQPSTPLASQASAIQTMRSIIEQVRMSGPTLPPDVQTAFTTYRALDRLRVLAQLAVSNTSSLAERTKLQLTFAKGLADLQTFIAGAPTDKLTFAFGNPARRVETVALDPTPPPEVNGAAVVAERSAALPGLTGTERFSLSLSRGTTRDTVTVDLAQTPQPPTLDSIAAAFNAAISALPKTNLDGSIVTDANGAAVPKYSASFKAVKTAEGWGLQLNSIIDQVRIDQIGAGDALIVAGGQTALDAPTATALYRFDDPAGAIERNSIGGFSAIDRLASAEAKLLPQPKPLLPDTPPPSTDVMAATTPRAIATDAEGFSYVVGTTTGDLASNLGDGAEDLFLTKLDSDGAVVWQRTLGSAGSATGAAISLAANGDIVVAGTVKGDFDGAQTDGDMLVARFSAAGDEQFATVVRTVGADVANAVAVAGDGTIYVGGRASTGTGDAFLARLDATGRLVERRTLDSGSSDTVRALRVDSDGSLVALTSEGGAAVVRRIAAGGLATDLGSINLGTADARALAIGSDGSIAVAGATQARLSGAQANDPSGGRDGFVTRIDAGLGSASTSYLGSAADDQIDSVTFMSGALYVGGRTTGALSGSRAGPVDGFVARVNAGSGAVETISQWGRTGVRAEPVQVSAAPGGDSAIGALGFRRGTINPDNSLKLTAQTTLRAGDEFAFRVNGGTLKRLTIVAGDTLTTLADRLRQLVGSNITISTPKVDGRSVLRIEAKAGHMLELVAGREGKDALEKLGLDPSRIIAAAPIPSNAPRVRPGGNYGLDLSEALNISDQASAKLALERIDAAISTSQSAFRSLYWDSNKAAIVDGAGKKGSVSPYLAAQASRYQDALNRLTSGGSAGTGIFKA
jgi:trimeric autotransporter adhesin